MGRSREETEAAMDLLVQRVEDLEKQMTSLQIQMADMEKRFLIRIERRLQPVEKQLKRLEEEPVPEFVSSSIAACLDQLATLKKKVNGHVGHYIGGPAA